MRWFPRTDYRSFHFLNATQFLGALNDNVFKLLVIYLLIHLKGPDAANAVLSTAGAIFVIPFLLFSSTAGILADRLSKRAIIVFSKLLELLVMLFGLIVVAFHMESAAYMALFFMAAQSALFGPSKYGIIPEIVEPKMMSKANGSMTSFTYLAIILGTFLASFITDISHNNFYVVVGFCIFVALTGLITSLGIATTDGVRTKKKIHPFFLYEIYQTLKVCWKVPQLTVSLFGSSFFLFIGAFTQLNIIPFAIQSLHLKEVGGGYLFLATAVGIAIGATLAGQISKDKVEPGISCVAGFLIPIFFFTLYLFSHSLICTIISLALLGIVGGGFLIPFDSFIQINSPQEKRGQVIATTNFFSFLGVFLSAVCLYLISEEFGFSAESGFALMGILALLANIVLTGRLSSYFFPFFVNRILKRFRTVKIASAIPPPSHITILQSNSWLDALLLFSCLPRLKILAPGRFFQQFPFINGWIDSIHMVPFPVKSEAQLEKLFKKAEKFQKENYTVCLFLHEKFDTETILHAYKKIFGDLNYQLAFAHGTKEKKRCQIGPIQYTQRQITLTFTRE